MLRPASSVIFILVLASCAKEREAAPATLDDMVRIYREAIDEVTLS